MSAGRPRELARLLARDQRGVTIVEAMVAALLLVVGALAVLSLIDSSTRNSYRTEQSQAIYNRLQGELEEIRQLSYGEVALTAAPSTASDPNGPLGRVNASGTQFALRRDGAEPANLVVNGGPLGGDDTVSGGTIDPGPDPFQVGDVSGNIFRFVVWRNDFRCDEARCPGEQDRKRVVVAVKLDDAAAASERAYQEVQSDFVDPTARPVANPLPPGDPPVNAQSLHLSDTTCNYETRQPIEVEPGTDHHAVHNTLGSCETALMTGDEPDRLFTTKAPLDDCCAPDQQPIFDYAKEIEPVQNPGNDKGLQMLSPDADGCVYTPAGESAPRTTHRWVTAPMAAGFTYAMEGTATLKLWTRTINDATHEGRICIFLFTRELDVNGNEVDVLISDSLTNQNHWTYYDPTWPPSALQGGWSEITLPMEFEAPTRVFPSERLGLAIQVEKQGTSPGEALQFIYDHPSFDTRLEIETSTPLP